MRSFRAAHDSYLTPPDEPEGCIVCGHHVDDCLCPECPECGEYGNPQCYTRLHRDDLDGDDHGLVLSREQEIARVEMEIAGLKDQISSVEYHLEWLKRGD